ncbi:MAG: hypothetical protein RAP41_05100 [Candidatus Orphnella occulta]|nr:hypothetical protein [Candidatus Orphnella occulta]
MKLYSSANNIASAFACSGALAFFAKDYKYVAKIPAQRRQKALAIF